MTTDHAKSKRFSRKITNAAAKHGVQGELLNTPEYKELVRKHAAAIAFISGQEDRELDLMIRDLQRLKAEKL